LRYRYPSFYLPISNIQVLQRISYELASGNNSCFSFEVLNYQREKS
jgi:hypothetical protein